MPQYVSFFCTVPLFLLLLTKVRSHTLKEQEQKKKEECGSERKRKGCENCHFNIFPPYQLRNSPTLLSFVRLQGYLRDSSFQANYVHHIFNQKNYVTCVNSRLPYCYAWR